VFVAIRGSSASARRQPQDLSRGRQEQGKHYDEPLIGRIASLDGERDHGFMSTNDERLIYFYRNSVGSDGFDVLTPGQAVRFSEDRGEKGPQATFARNSFASSLRSRSIPPSQAPLFDVAWC
jgi:cold shock CspA family protein